jgi:hypothetical protein
MATANGFVSSEAAPSMTLDQYKAYRWQAEADAFERQSRVLAEVAKNRPWLAACVKQAYQKDPLLRPDLTREQREKGVRERYSGEDLEAEWDEHRDDEVPGPIRDQVNTYRKSGEMRELVDHWRP